jgi:HK97 family phage major capsid protein
MKSTREFLSDLASKRSVELEELAKRVEALEKINGESEDEEELKAAGTELDELNAKKAELEAELADINAQIAELDKPTDKEGEGNNQRNKFNFMTKESRGNNTMTHEERTAAAEKFVANGKMTIKNEETRAMLVSSGKIATPTDVKGINELPNEVSSIIDMVDVEDCTGMGNNKIAYEFTAPVGGVTVEGETYAEGETVTDFVTTTPQTITTISYISKQVTKQSPLKYEEKVRKNALAALRKKVSAIIVEKIKASALSIKKTIAKIDEKTLRTIALSYGGDENVSGNAVLLVNKNTLTALGDVRGTNEKKAVYEITPDTSNTNTGIIKDGGLSVKYVLNSNVADNELIYGQALKCELDIYSDYEVKVSEDFKFDKGMLAIRGDVEADAAVTFKDGFIVATVGA